jgi:hypothetical protein
MMDNRVNLNVLNVLAQVQGFSLEGNLGDTLLNVGKALLILIIGLILVNIIKGQIKKWLHKTDIDNRLVAIVIGDRPEDSSQIQIEKWIAEIVGWIITLFVIIAFFNTLELEAVSQPLNTLLDTVIGFLPRVGSAIFLLVLAWAIATIVKLFVTKTLNQFGLDEKLNQQIQETDEEDREGQEIALGETIGNGLYWFIYLLFLPSILGVLRLEGTLRPLEELVNNILGIIPNVFAAILIASIGWIIAQIVKKVVINLLKASGANALGTKFGLSATEKNQSLAYLVGSVVYVLVLIPIAITALDALQVKAISTPSIAMLNQVLEILPNLLAAIVIIGLAYFGGQYLSELISNLLTSIGFNNVFVWLGITDPTKIEEEEIQSDIILEEEQGTQSIKSAKTPAEIVGVIVLVAVMLVSLLTAVDILQISALREMVAFILLLAGQVLVGVIILGIGLYFANLVFKLIANSGTNQAHFLAQIARIGIIILVSAMALERIGIAPNIVNLAFGLLTGGIAVAIALAFGLGGRETAGKALEQWFNSFNQK